ncbi:MAG: AI-2E family transporter [Rhodospirillaceae bacterium]|nr:AI-2E family transporter [Rhodospirillaceae bacterium]
MELFRDWYALVGRNRQLALLLVLLAAGTTFVVLTAGILAPFYAALIIAYVMETAANRMQRLGMPRNGAVAIVFGVFLGVLFGVFALLPLLGSQLMQFITELPQFVSRAQGLLVQLPEKYPSVVSPEQVATIVDDVRTKLLSGGQNLAKYLGGTVVGLVTVLVYLIIIPVMIFFMLKDKERIVGWVESFMPAHHQLSAAVWRDVNRQLQNFVGGKVAQMVIVAIVSFIVFSAIDLDYAPLLAVIIGVAVMIPYIGAAAATVPVAAVALIQWGVSFEAGVAVGSYLVIHALDGNVLVPLLFSEAVKIHPVAIIVAILFFGGIFGVWGVFFGIPLAVVVKAVMTAWPKDPAAAA